MANFFIQTDKPYYFAGDTVTGSILVNVVTFIQATGISLKFSGYQCVKWNQSRQIVRPHHVQGQPPPPDPIAAIPPHLIFQSDNFDVSEVESEDDNYKPKRPRYIRTSAGRVYEMFYHDTKNVFTRIKTNVYICNGLAPGQYSFPISFKTFQGWPASFNYDTPRKKGRIIYHLTAAVQPYTKAWNLSHAIQITLRQTKPLKAQTIQSNVAVTSCCCLSKGTSAINVHFQKDGYIPGEQVNLIIQVDNTNCQANIQNMHVSVTNTVGLRANNGSTSDTFTVFSKLLPGLPMGIKKVGNDAIRDGFILQSNGQIKPTCNGKLLSSVFDLSVRMSHDVACSCCSDEPTASIRVMIFPIPIIYQLPQTFVTNWTPKLMPIANIALTNNFANFNMSAMQQPMMQQQMQQPMMQQQMQQPMQQAVQQQSMQGNYPPQQQQMQGNYPPQQQQMQGNYPPQQQQMQGNYPQQQMQQNYQ